MTAKHENLSDIAAGFDQVIDVRAPCEFAEDHVPGALNLPVLSDAERARVGTIYVQQSPFLARKIGGALVMRNIATHLSERLADKPKSWRPLVYCWRGGQRSRAMVWLLREVGWRAEQLKGGYKTYRRVVKTALYDTPLAREIVLLDGNTGTAKTELLHRLAREGVATLDLEGIAQHRGSVFGEMGVPQPSQRLFERDIAQALEALPPGPVLVEAESSKVGDRLIPPSLWRAMQAAPRIRLEATLEARAAYLAVAYLDILQDAPKLRATLARLAPMIGHKAVAEWSMLAQEGSYEAFTAAIMAKHYDPRYEKSRARCEAQTLKTVRLGALDDAGLAQATREIKALMDAR